MVLYCVEWMGKRIGKVNHSIWERASNKKKKTRRTKSSHVKVATGTWQSWKEYDIEKGQKKRVADKKTFRTRKVSIDLYNKPLYTMHEL